MSKHTPGPWTIAHDNNEVVIRSGVPHDVICNLVAGVDGPDARLIAAAPDLLAALNTIAKIASEGRESDIDIESIARAAIARAKG